MVGRGGNTRNLRKIRVFSVIRVDLGLLYKSGLMFSWEELYRCFMLNCAGELFDERVRLVAVLLLNVI